MNAGDTVYYVYGKKRDRYIKSVISQIGDIYGSGKILIVIEDETLAKKCNIGNMLRWVSKKQLVLKPKHIIERQKKIELLITAAISSIVAAGMIVGISALFKLIK